MICKNCDMLTTPMGTLCEFCGEDVRTKATLPIEQENDRRITEGLCPDCGSELREASGENAVADPSDNYGVSYQKSTWRECVKCDYSEEL